MKNRKGIPMRSDLDRILSMEWIDYALKAKFKASALAQLCGVSLRHLDRYFDEAFRQPPKRWLKNVRILLAAQMVTQQKSQKEIAFALGFSGTPHFVDAFKRHYGCTPRAYHRIETSRSNQATKTHSPTMRAVDEQYRRAPIHPRDEHVLLCTHKARIEALSKKETPFGR